MELIIEPVEGQTQEDVEFEWSVVSFLPNKLTLQIEFMKPYEISMANDLNLVKVNIWDPSLFLRAKDLVPIAPLSSTTKIIPRIVEKTYAKLFETAAITLSNTGTGGIILAFLLGFGFNMGMNKVLSQVRNLGFVTHLMMMQLMYPVTLTLFFSKVFEFVTFDIIPTELIYPHIFDLPEGAFSEEADSIGYYSRYIILNAGSITIFLCTYIVLQIILAIMVRTLSEGKLLRYVRLKQNSFMWSGLIDFFTDIYLTLSSCFFINISSFKFESPSESINNTYNVVIGIALVLGPIFVVGGLYKKWKETLPTNLEDEVDDKSKKAKKYYPEEEEKVAAVLKQDKPKKQAGSKS